MRFIPGTRHDGTASAVDEIAAGETAAPCRCCPARRKVLSGLAALGAGALVGRRAAVAQPSPPSLPRLVDVHHHLSSPGFIAEITARKTGQQPLADWTPAKSIEDMDRGGVATSITSISEPGVWFGEDEPARRLARECNDYAARLMADHPGRFGMFATVPMPDVDGSLREIEYALDVLKADGVCLLTSYRSKYLGDPAFAPVLDELNRRKTVVYTHPVRADCCRNLVPDVAEPVIELGTDTTRTIASLLFSGTAARCADIRFIFSHAGGTLPFLTQRIVGWAAARKDLAARLPKGALYELQRFYYDTANAAHPYALSSLLKLVSTSQIVFGTDFPFVTSQNTAKGLVDYGFAARDLAAICRDNAVALLPRLNG